MDIGSASANTPMPRVSVPIYPSYTFSSGFPFRPCITRTGKGMRIAGESRNRERRQRAPRERVGGGWSRVGSQRKLTRRERTPVEAKENTLVKYKGYSRHCNRVISRNPFPRASRGSRMRINTNPRSARSLLGIRIRGKNASLFNYSPRPALLELFKLIRN